MIWILVLIVVIAIYNAERLPELMNRFKNEVPHLVETGKKLSKDIKEKAQTTVAEKKKDNTKTEKKSK